MNLTIDSKVLAEALALAFTSSQMEIYENILVEAKGKQLTLTSQDGMKQRITSLPVVASKSGRTVINPKPIRGVLSGLTGDVELNLRASKAEDTPSSIVIKQDSKIGSRKYDFKVMAADAFPVFDQTDDVKWDVDCESLAAAMQEVSYAAGEKDPRPYLNAVFIGRNAVVGCDGHRAAIVEFETGNVELIVPIDCVNSIQQFMASGKDVKAKYHAAGDQFYRIGLESEGQEVAAKLLTGKYIDFTRVMPNDKDAKFLCKINRDEFMKSIDRLIAGRSFEKLIKMDFVPESETVMRITGSGDLTDYVSCTESKNDGAPEISINAIYMREALRAITTEFVWLFVKDENSAVWFRPDVGNSVHFILPIRR